MLSIRALRRFQRESSGTSDLAPLTSSVLHLFIGVLRESVRTVLSRSVRFASLMLEGKRLGQVGSSGGRGDRKES